MDCRVVREKMGAYLDGELSDPQGKALEEHINTCRSCMMELETIRDLTGRLRQAANNQQDIRAPKELWSAIEQKIEQDRIVQPARRFIGLFRKPLAAAASLAIIIGIGAFLGTWLSTSTDTAQAFTVDYSMLLDGLAVDVDTAVDRFLTHYKAVAIKADKAQTAAPDLQFAIPPELPGGFRLEQAYQLQFGSTRGVAARYRRDSEPLVVFFHPPVNKQRLGIHRDSTCHVAGREGHRVEVGPWQLIHFTDPTTCHCLLSKMETDSELIAVLKAVSLNFQTQQHQ